MKIETKFNVGDSVYFLNNSKVMYKEIYEVCTGTTITKDNIIWTSICYELREFSGTFREEDLFATKEELIRSL